MKVALMLAATVALLASGACGPAAMPTPRPYGFSPSVPADDLPRLSSEEVKAKVYTYLEERVSRIAALDTVVASSDTLERLMQQQQQRLRQQQRQSLLRLLNTARPSFSARYLGNGTWEVGALGYARCQSEPDKNCYYHNLGKYRLYEAGGTIEPNDEHARWLLQHLDTLR